MVQSQLGQIVRETPPILKITRAKGTGGVVQAVACLLCKCKALSSNLSLTTNKKERNPIICNNMDEPGDAV
jgi:hypothetical protein